MNTLDTSDIEIDMRTQGSRRRRLWELGSHAHCPVVGVCLPIASLRHLIDKALSGHALADDYELHCGAITECRRRTPIAEALQRELDRRCAIALRGAARAKTTEALLAWWSEASQADLAGALWATLTHARCTPVLETRVLGEVHMRQHQVGASQRVDVKRFEALSQAHEELTNELHVARARWRQQLDEQTRRTESQQSEIMKLRALLIARDTTISRLNEQIDTAANAPQFARDAQRDAIRDAHRIHALERELARALRDVERHRQSAHAPTEIDARPAAPPSELNAEAGTPRLDDRSVLCVGGRPASIPIYRELVERTGGRFLHHDGGEEESVTKLDATLAAADLVICQAGCVSHGAYWRVKDHCKRTGKRCVFIDSPSAAGIKRALAALQARQEHTA